MRTPGIIEKTLWENYSAALLTVMREQNKAAGNPRYRSISLDANRSSRNGAGSFPLLDILKSAKRQDKVWTFLDTLPAEEREACEAAIFDFGKSAEKSAGISDQIRNDLKRRYEEFDSHSIW